MDPIEDNQDSRLERVRFAGQAGEYFGIWMVNNIFTWLTLGIYSAWAKVRTLRYFYGNTAFAGGRFQFTAEPLKILRGRIIAALLFILYLVSDNIDSTQASIVFGVLIAAYLVFAPVLTVLVVSFKLRYSQWRGISFNFNKNYRESYRVYLIPMTLFGLFLGSFAIPYYSTEVEEFFGYESPAYQSDEEVESTECQGSDGDDEASLEETTELEQGDSTNASLGELESSEEFVESDIDVSRTEQADADSQESTEEESVEEEAYDEDEYYEDEYGLDEEENYWNPYLTIPAGILGLIFVLLFPYFDFIHLRFLSRNARLGTAPFRYDATVKDYYEIYGKWFAAALLLVGLWWLLSVYDVLSFSWMFGALIIVSMIFIPATRAYFKSKRYNLLLNKTVIDGKHQLRANTEFPMLFWILISNSIVVAVTLGMMKPWAQIRTARYILEHTAVEVNGSLDDFVAEQEQEVNALAEEVADMFDIDIVG